MLLVGYCLMMRPEAALGQKSAVDASADRCPVYRRQPPLFGSGPIGGHPAVLFGASNAAVSIRNRFSGG